MQAQRPSGVKVEKTVRFADSVTTTGKSSSSTTANRGGVAGPIPSPYPAYFLAQVPVGVAQLQIPTMAQAAAAGAQQPIRNTRQNSADCQRIISGLKTEKTRLELAEKSGGVLKTLKDKAADMRSLLDLMKRKDTARAHQQTLSGLESDLYTIEDLISNESQKFADLNAEIDTLNAQVQAVLAKTKAYDRKMYVTYGELEQKVKLFLIPASETDRDAPLTKLWQLERNLTGQSSHYTALGQLYQQATQKERIGKKSEITLKDDLKPLKTMLDVFHASSTAAICEILKIINTIQHLQNETKNNIGTAREKLKEYLKLIIKQHRVFGVDDKQADAFIDMIIGYAAHTGRRMHLPFSVSRTNSIEQIMNYLTDGTRVKVDHSKKNVIDITHIDSDIANKKQEISRLEKAKASIAHKSEIVKAVSKQLTQINCTSISNMDEAHEIEEALNRTDQDLKQAMPPQSSFSVVTMQQSYDQEKQQLIQAHATATAALAQKRAELHRVKVQAAVNDIKMNISEMKKYLEQNGIQFEQISLALSEAQRIIGFQGKYKTTDRSKRSIDVPKIHPFATELLFPQKHDGLRKVFASVFGDKWIQAARGQNGQFEEIELDEYKLAILENIVTDYTDLLVRVAEEYEVSISDILGQLSPNEKKYLDFIDAALIMRQLLQRPNHAPGTQLPANIPLHCNKFVQAAAQRLGMV